MSFSTFPRIPNVTWTLIQYLYRYLYLNRYATDVRITSSSVYIYIQPLVIESTQSAHLLAHPSSATKRGSYSMIPS